MEKIFKNFILRIKRSSLRLYVKIYSIVLVISIIIIITLTWTFKILGLKFYANLLGHLGLIFLDLLEWVRSREKNDKKED